VFTSNELDDAVHRVILHGSWQNHAPVSVAVLLPRYPASASIGDPSATRTVYVTVVLLVVLAVALAALAIWLARRTRPERQLLAPLEEMNTRAWRKQDPAAQRRALDAARPAGAQPVRPEAAEPTVDSEFAAERPVVGFDDLADDADDTDGGDAADSADDTDSADDDQEASDDADAPGELETDSYPVESDDTVLRPGGS
jgi:hypothetical protein